MTGRVTEKLSELHRIPGQKRMKREREKRWPLRALAKGRKVLVGDASGRGDSATDRSLLSLCVIVALTMRVAQTGAQAELSGARAGQTRRQTRRCAQRGAEVVCDGIEADIVSVGCELS